MNTTNRADNGGSISGSELYARLLQYVRPYWQRFGVAMLALALLALSEPLLPWLIKPLLDGSFVEGQAQHFTWVPILIVTLFVIRGLVSYAGSVQLHWVAHRVVMDLRREMFARLIGMPASFYDESSSGELISKFTYDVTQVREASTRVLNVLVNDTLTIVALVAFMVYLNWVLSLVVLAIGPLAGLVVIAISRRLREMSRRVQQSMGMITHVAQEAIEGQKPVKVFGGQDYELGRFGLAINDARKFAMKVVMASAANVPIIQTIVAAGLAVMIYVALDQYAKGFLTQGGFVAFFTTMTLLLAPVKRLTGINEHLQRGLAAAESVFGLIDQPLEPDFGTTEITRANGVIRFEEVSFAYHEDRTEALVELSFEVAAGETVALVGASGSGKTTIANLIPRFYPVSSGRILLDDVDINQITLNSLRDNIALVSQDVVLFNDTIRNNIAYGAMRSCTEEQVRTAADAAHVSDFVSELPQQLDTMIGENGVRLSGGQRQRLAIARALLKDAPLLILDEATSSLDAASERHIQEALELLRQGRTCFVIAHRLSTIETADRIVVLAGGRIIEVGTHHQLLEQQGTYTQLYRTQFGNLPTEN